MDKYSNEVQERWGDTPAYTEYSGKTKGIAKQNGIKQTMS